MRLQCAVPASEKFTVQLCALYFRHDVIRLSSPRSWQCVPSVVNVNVKNFKKGRVNGGSNCGSLKDSQKSFFWATLSGLRVNVPTPSIARWKPRGRLYICHDWPFFVISYSWNVISRKVLKSAFFEGVGHFERRFQMEGASPSNRCWCQKTRVIAVSCCIRVKKPNPAGFNGFYWAMGFLGFSPLTTGLYLVGTALTRCI